MKPILFIQNVTIEGPGTLGLFLKQRNIPFEIRDLYGGMNLPDKTQDYGAIVILGGPMNIYEEDRFPFLTAEKSFIRECLDSNIPILGICLGGQLLADALGGSVRPNEKSEIGWMDVNLTEEGFRSDIFAGISSPVPVFQWHGDTFEIPFGAKHLAWSPNCRNQAFSYKNRFIGLQFHLEVAAEEAIRWAKTYLPDTHGENRKAAERLIQDTNNEKSEQTLPVYERFAKNFFCGIAGYSADDEWFFAESSKHF